jgi:predicted  nucleic acid-binding Zn-ribbon protein
MSQSFKLFRLQQIDSIIDKGQTRLAEIDRMLADDLEIRLSKQKYEQSQRTIFEAEKKLRVAEENVREQRLKIERSQAALYGGKISNPKELQDLQHESEFLKKYLVTLEDTQLDAMLELDEAESVSKQVNQELKETEQNVAEQKQLLTKEKSVLIRDLQVNESERAATASTIDSRAITLYETLREQKNGRAVAQVVEKSCAACGSTLTASTFSSAQMPNKITRCDACGRILYAG